MLFMFNIQIRTLKLQQKKPAKLHACVCVLGRGSGQKKMFLYRGLSPGCYAICVRVVNFKSTKRKRKKKKKEKKSTKRLTAVAPYRNNEAGNGHQVHPVSFRSDKTPVYFVLFATSVRLEARWRANQSWSSQLPTSATFMHSNWMARLVEVKRNAVAI